MICPRLVAIQAFIQVLFFIFLLMNTETTNPCLDDSELLKEIIERTKKMERDIARILGERSEQD